MVSAVPKAANQKTPYFQGDQRANKTKTMYGIPPATPKGTYTSMINTTAPTAAIEMANGIGGIDSVFTLDAPRYAKMKQNRLR